MSFALAPVVALHEEISRVRASIHRDDAETRQKAALQARIVADGDAILFAWGDARRSGRIEAVLRAVAAQAENGQRIPLPGIYSNPTLAKILAAEDVERQLSAAVFLVDQEVECWRADRATQRWAEIADQYYCAAGHATNGSVARALGLSDATVERCRAQMRRLVLMASRRRFAKFEGIR